MAATQVNQHWMPVKHVHTGAYVQHVTPNKKANTEKWEL